MNAGEAVAIIQDARTLVLDDARGHMSEVATIMEYVSGRMVGVSEAYPGLLTDLLAWTGVMSEIMDGMLYTVGQIAAALDAANSRLTS